MKKLERLYQPRTDLTAYSPSLLRSLIGLACVLLSVCRKTLFPFLSLLDHPLFSLPMIFLGLIGLMQILSGLIEMSCTADNLRLKKLKEAAEGEAETLITKPFPFDEVISMLEREDLMDFEIISGSELYLISASSDTRTVRTGLFKSHEEYFNKRYFIDEKEFSSIDDFRAALMPFSKDGMLAVYAVDGAVQE